MSDNASATTFQVGDRVQVTAPESTYYGMVGEIIATNSICVGFAGPGSTPLEFEADELVSPINNLIAAVEAAGAVEFNRWVADGMLCRRHISPDGNIDLTVRVP